VLRLYASEYVENSIEYSEDSDEHFTLALLGELSSIQDWQTTSKKCHIPKIFVPERVILRNSSGAKSGFFGLINAYFRAILNVVWIFY
jgi:hypothetical protein